MRSSILKAGDFCGLVAGVISKIIKLPIYKTVTALKSDDVVRLKKERQKLNTGNMLQAILYFVAGALMTIACCLSKARVMLFLEATEAKWSR